MIATSHAGPHDGQVNASTIVVTAIGHFESASALDGPSSGQKTAKTAKTAHGQKGSVTSHGESTFVHETANDLWSESATRETGHATPETVNRHSDALHENLNLVREMNVKSVSGSGPW